MKQKYMFFWGKVLHFKHPRLFLCLDFYTSFCLKTTPPLIGRFLTVDEFFRFNEDLTPNHKKVAKTAHFAPFPRRIERRFGITLCLTKKSAHILRMQADNH